MKLYSANPSPFSRKARVLAIELGLQDRLEVKHQMPRDGSTGFFDINPLARIPALQTDDLGVLVDSPVICEYLNALGKGPFFPASGPRRWTALRRQAIGDGLLDTAMLLRGERMREPAQQSEEITARTTATVLRVLDALEREAAAGLEQPLDIGDVAIGCALAWLDFRLPDLDWQASRPALAAWNAAIQARPSFETTRPA